MSDTDMESLVSVGVPVWNGQKYLQEALDAIRSQDYPNIEIIISDNGSTDATEVICRSAASRDPRIRYFRNDDNRGGSWNFNRVAELARGPFFMWAAADDVIRSSYVSECVSALTAGAGTVLACPRTQLIDASGAVFDELGDCDLQGDQQRPYQRIGNVLRRQASHLVYGVMCVDALRRTRGIRPVIGDDVTLLTELLCLGKIVVTPHQLFLQRRHVDQFSSQGRGQVKWFSPNNRARLALPQTRLNIELIRGVLAADLPVSEKARCVLAVLRYWVIPRWRGMAGDFLAIVRPG